MATNLNNIATLLKRLEAVVSRLEDIGSSTNSIDLSGFEGILQQDVSSLANDASASIVRSGVGVSPQATPDSVSQDLELFDTFLQDVLGSFLQLSYEVGGLVAQQADMLAKGFEAQRVLLLTAKKTKKPRNDAQTKAFKALLQPVEDAIASCESIQESGRGSPVFHLLSAVADGAFILTWITAEGRPWLRVEKAYSMAQFFGNKVLKDNSSDSIERRWTKAFYAIFLELMALLKRLYPQGITWNGRGHDLQDIVFSEKVSSG